MKEYTHNGVIVLFKSTRSYLSDLNDQGIYPVELPIIADYTVYKTIADGRPQYAAVKTYPAPEDVVSDDVYITETIPEDGFGALIEDVNNQREGGEPYPMKSRLKAIIELAIDTAEKDIYEKCKVDLRNYMMYGFTEEEKKVYNNICKRVLWNYGYYNENSLKGISASEKDKELALQILTQ